MGSCEKCGTALPDLLQEQMEFVYTCSCGEKFRADCGKVEPIICEKQEQIYELEQKLEQSKRREEQLVEQLSDLKDKLRNVENGYKVFQAKLKSGEALYKELQDEIASLKCSG